MSLTLQAISSSETALLHEGVRVISFGPSGVINSVVVSEITNNAGSFDCATGQDFRCTPAGAFTLTFTNIPPTPRVQKGTVLLINTGGFAVAAHANVRVSSSLLSRLIDAGTYVLGYRTSAGLVYITSSEALV